MHLIVNPAAAGGRLGREWPHLEARLRSLGLDGPVLMTEAPGHAASLAEQVAREGADPVVVVGGDGTVCEAATGLYRAGRGRLAIVPLGTGNDAARTLGVPLEIEAAARAAVAGRGRWVDLIRVGEWMVVNAIGIGLTADISERAARIKWLRGIAVYLMTALVSLVRFQTPQVRLIARDGVRYDGAMTIVAIHNGPTTGGGFRLTPEAVPDDGLLDVTVVPGVGPLGRVPRLVAAMRGTLGGMAGTLELAVPWLEVECERPLPMHLDGNQSVLQPPSARFEVVANAIEVLVPSG